MAEANGALPDDVNVRLNRAEATEGSLMVRAYSSVVEHYVDIVGVASSILATPTIGKPRFGGVFSFPLSNRL